MDTKTYCTGASLCKENLSTVVSKVMLFERSVMNKIAMYQSITFGYLPGHLVRIAF